MRSVKELCDSLQDKPLILVARMIALMEEKEKFVAEVFRRDISFHRVVDISFQTVMNKLEKMPQYIALYLDEAMKSTFRNMKSVEI